MAGSRDSGGETFNPFAAVDPPRDEALAALLRQADGVVPLGAVDWDALASRIARSLPGRATITWWSYAERWSQRLLPLAFAASLLGAVALWDADELSSVVGSSAAVTDVVAEVVQGAPVEDAARSFARTVTADVTMLAAED
ncbi:MAG: hypothetical protein JF589_12500 [Gemmatimonadetes bacterium]|jgi:hypothetical protein|nr:hypothetical protein [Gemmatimonadota bacterium]